MIIILTAFSVTAYAAGMEVPANLQVALFYKIFDFDQSLMESADSQITIGIYYDPSIPESNQAKNEIEGNFVKLSDKKIGDKSVVIREITDIGDLHDINIVYVTPGLDLSISAIIAKCNSYKILGISGVEAYVQAGLAIAIELNDQKPQIIINKSGAQLSGVKLSSKILALAKIL